ncbi:glutamate--tRNA ligase [Mycoplasma sp. CSL7475-4]|uniref:glutamate--tRNA ligase n=1 Tax=Mycoplasma sp. CSL7475-4 TaxID=2973942 RepID=UPI00216ACD05|nr:glutamate--tRNA ligase [Mycoplasma sp. CSL7475-4]MCS4536922.1 glutamate--tRNA ligase [Mycoplasma sp. CSL7475-4]
MTKKIRTRYAPSPTGYLHIGGARTALFSYLFAKHFNGEFVFRLEDTDVKRNVEDGERSQLENLAWLGIIPDESPFKPNPNCGKYRQSEKLDRYREVAQQLLDAGLAYKAYDNSEELEAQRAESEAKGIPSFKYDKNWLKISDEEKMKREKNGQFSIRLSMPKNIELGWDDLVRGPISFNSSDIGDWVIVKSDGYPTYNFAVVIDDHDMSISHVLRGEEHITNTPKQLVIYNALGWDAPSFGHLTVITNMEGKKLSKRDTSLKQFIEDYRNEGYVPEAVFNFLTLLGWTSEDASEIMSKEEIIAKFDPQRLSKSPSKFDIVKMHWFSKQYFKNLDNTLIAKSLNIDINQEWSKLFIETFKESVGTISELKNHLLMYKNTQESPIFELNAEEINVVKEFFAQLKDLEFSIENIQAAINETKQNLKVNGKKLFMPIRKATTFAEHGPELAKAIYLFGKDKIIERLKIWQ